VSPAVHCTGLWVQLRFVRRLNHLPGLRLRCRFRLLFCCVRLLACHAPEGITARLVKSKWVQHSPRLFQMLINLFQLFGLSASNIPGIQPLEEPREIFGVGAPPQRLYLPGAIRQYPNSAPTVPVFHVGELVVDRSLSKKRGWGFIPRGSALTRMSLLFSAAAER
jgi:hypothetical protein